MLNNNMDVDNAQANGTMCTFQSVVLKDGLSISDLETIIIDGYHVLCADVSQIKHLKVEISDANNQVAYIDPVTVTLKAYFPLPIYGDVNKYTKRFYRSMRMTQFPVNCANARTIHKLQGRSIEHLVISSWDYKGNWVYVALSRVKQLKNLYLRKELSQAMCSVPNQLLRQFMERLRKKETSRDYLYDST